MNSTIKLVIFDLDGTLVDAYQAVASSLNYALNQLGYDPIEDGLIKRTVGFGDRHLVGAFVKEKDIDKVLSIFRLHHARALKVGTVFLPGAKQLLKKLKAKKYTLAIASNRPTRFTRIILKHLGLQQIFDYVLCGDKVKHPKPEADILLNIMAKFSISPRETLYIGDMTIDVETGNKAGVKTVAVTTGSSTQEEMVLLKPHAIIANVLQAADILENMAKFDGIPGSNISC